MLIRDSKIPTMQNIFELINPNTQRMEFDNDQARRAIQFDEPLIVNGRPYYLSDEVKQWIGTTCFYNDENTMEMAAILVAIGIKNIFFNFELIELLSCFCSR